jgi:hypothetical protein
MDSTKALAILTQHATQKSLVFASREDVESVAPQFEPVVTVLQFELSDFVDVGMGNMYPSKSATNRIADATGVSFLPGAGGTRPEGDFKSVKIVDQGGFTQAYGEFKVIGSAQGQRLKPDGTPRFSSVREYEFNVIDRANRDFLKKPENYKTEAQARAHLLELKQFATQRASTGAQLAVVRELAGIPTAFKRDQIGKPMVFSQIIENNRFKLDIAKEIMKTPDGRQAVAAALFGTSQKLFGPQPVAPAQVQAPPSEVVREAEGSDMAVPPDDDDDLPAGTAPAAAPATDPRVAEIIGALAEWVESESIPSAIASAIQRLIDRGESRLGILEPFLELVKLLGEKKVGKNCETGLVEALPNPDLDEIILNDLVTRARANAKRMAEVAGGKAAQPANAGASA